MIFDLQIEPNLKQLEQSDHVVVCGLSRRLKQRAWAQNLPSEIRRASEPLLDELKAGDAGAMVSTRVLDPGLRLTVVGLADVASRHNHRMHPHALSKMLRTTNRPEARFILMVVDDYSDALAMVAAAARALPGFSRKTERGGEPQRVRLAFFGTELTGEQLDALQVIAEEVRYAARLVDMPAAELHTESFTELARQTATLLGTEVSVLEGETLAHAGLGGLWGVGKAATRGPSLVILEAMPTKPSADTRTIALVGKGIVYDTGGLSIKTKTGMPGMKADMGGAAAVLAGFRALMRRGTHHRVIAILCLAENAVGPDATRPDDILTMYSGKTVEVNNTDAEGRLVLADGVAYAQRHFQPDYIIDVATLTGAQLVATGQRHAAAVSNQGDLEALAVAVGLETGDLVHPLPYCPEFFRAEFKSEVADLKNSVKNRANAQSSCAGQFIAEHLGDFAGGWLHLDIAGPSTDAERGTGFGTVLLTELVNRLS